MFSSEKVCLDDFVYTKNCKRQAKQNLVRQQQLSIIELFTYINIQGALGKHRTLSFLSFYF
jgi:hypothetical protein